MKIDFAAGDSRLFRFGVNDHHKGYFQHGVMKLSATTYKWTIELIKQGDIVQGHGITIEEALMNAFDEIDQK